MEQIEQQVRTKFRFVKEKNLTVDNKHKEIGLFSISEKSLSIGIGGNSYIYLPSIETLNEDFVNKISYTRDMIGKADVEMVYSKSEVDDKIAQAIAGSVVDLSDYYNKSEVDDKLLLKADLSLVYTKTDVDDLIALIPNFDSSLYYNKSDIDGKLALKLDINTYNSDKINYVLRSDLVNYYLKGDIDSKLDKKVNVVDYKADKLTFATKDELNLKLDASTYNSDKLAYALKTDLSDINVKLEKFNNSIRPVLSLTEDTAAVEGQLDKQAWLTQKLKTDKKLDPENGLVIITSDGDSYFYFDGQWVLRKTYKVGSVTNSTSGIVLGKDKKGHGYIKASDALDGTMVLVDYQDIVDSIRTKAESSTVSALEGRVGTVESQLANKVESTTLDAYYPSATVDSLLSAKLNSADAARNYATKSEVSVKANQSSIGDLTNTGLTGNTVTELLTDAKTKIDDINISNYYPISKTYNRTEVDGFLTSKANDNAVVKLTGNQTVAGNKTFSGTSKFTGFIDVDAAPYNLSSDNYCMLRFVGDKWSSGQSADLIRFHKFGPVCGYKVYLNGTSFNYAEIYGLTLISNMKDPTADAHGANVKWVKGYSLPKVTTNAVNTIQVNSSASKYFNFDYVVEGTGYRNWSGIQLRAKQDSRNFETMWKVEYRNENTLGLFMECIGNKLNFESDTKIVGVSCEDSDGEKTAASKKYVDGKIGTLTSLTTTNKNNVVNAINEVNDNMPVVLPAGTQPTTSNIGSMKVAFVLK